ncbi:protein LATERAL ROOT PRIMORDIUM 1-like [Impatiens glandulifera]|uniref:protein LATERAL ROOT PRIMORDIUM 1-like n=1 Tax=Impatiens glandulifera TaxID=253017 RepID=UPI001FB12328|nr:protein LATERAL ROOT PRIMORDIUM 1-like [Impatiens glandulifera]
MWQSSSVARQINYGVPHDMGMVGHLRDVYVVAPASTFHHHHHHDGMISDQINGPNSTAGIQVWQNQQPVNYLQGGSGGGGGGGSSSSTGAGGTLSCQDCGNQAKKDCSHRRCRTCCQSRGFDCTTHVKSTWVSAARRRERQLIVPNAVTAGSSGSTSGTKKPRLITSQTTTTSHTSTSRSFETTSSHQEASFKETLPGQVRAPAVFKCVRVTAMDDGDDEYAYQAVVKIGGHVFKGFLYDQGVEARDGFPNISDLHLGGGRNGGSTSSPPVMDPSEVYVASGIGLLGGGGGGGSAYGNQIN